MLLVKDIEDKDFLTKLFEAMYNELPALKKKKWIEKQSILDEAKMLCFYLYAKQKVVFDRF